MAKPNDLRFVWWNVQSFAHLEPERAGAPRYPSCREEYEAKRDRIETALRQVSAERPPDVIGLCEITEPAARELRERLFSAHRLVFPVATDPFQVAVLARERFGFRALAPLRPARVPGTARPVPVLDFRRGAHHLRWYFCHWTAFGESAALYRGRAAEAVSEHMYRFLHDPAASDTRHVVALGDFNGEPFAEVFAARLLGARDRAPTGTPHRRRGAPRALVQRRLAVARRAAPARRGGRSRARRGHLLRPLAARVAHVRSHTRIGRIAWRERALPRRSRIWNNGASGRARRTGHPVTVRLERREPGGAVRSLAARGPIRVARR